MSTTTLSVVRFLSQAKYRYQDQTKKDILSVVNHYRNLTARLDKYVFPDGKQRDLVVLEGTIPVSYRGTIYNIPVCLWLPDQYPYAAPICYVKPTNDMTIKVSKHVDQSGRIYLPYLADWQPNNSDLLGVIQVMIIVFGDTPPVYSKPKPTAGPPAPGQPPYPTAAGYQPMPSNPSMPYPFPGASQSQPFSYGYQTGGPSPYPTVTQSQGPPPNPYPPYPSYGGYSQPTPVTSQQPVTTQSSPASATGTITEEHIRASLLSAVEDKIKKRVKEKVAQCQAEMDVLNKTSDDLNNGKTRLDEMMRRIENETAAINDTRQQLTTKNQQLTDLLIKYDTDDTKPDIDDAYSPSQPLYKQLIVTFAEENAVIDAIYFLGEALRKGVVDLEAFLKTVRELSRQQFMLRALIHVCREKAGLPV